MTKPNAQNERIKRTYFAFLREAHGRDVATIDSVAKSLARFEDSTKRRDFKRFHREQAVAFKAKLTAELNVRTGERLGKGTVLATLRDLRAFFVWLSREPGYKSHIAFSDADYFNLSDKDVAIARARREPNPPTVEQMCRVLAAMPAGNVFERRDRALVAFATLTVARVAALVSFRLMHVDAAQGYVEHDAGSVDTKAAKTFRTFFMPVVEGALEIVRNWIVELEREHAWGRTDPLFPQTEMGLDGDGSFAPVGLARRRWSTSEPVRFIFRRGFAAAGLPYHNPHSLRGMMVRHIMTLDLTPEELKAWSQNIGHSDPLTTFTSYGQIPTHRQGELIRARGGRPARASVDDRALLAALTARLTG
jgi:site-specific recombinase XerC